MTDLEIDLNLQARVLYVTRHVRIRMPHTTDAPRSPPGTLGLPERGRDDVLGLPALLRRLQALRRHGGVQRPVPAAELPQAGLQALRLAVAPADSPAEVEADETRRFIVRNDKTRHLTSIRMKVEVDTDDREVTVLSSRCLV